MITLPNCLSILRLPLALAFLQENVAYRILAIVLAMVSDWLDGYFARKYSLSSRLGTLLDPLMDKFFVFFVLEILINENRLTLLQAATMICRDFSVILFGFYLTWKGNLGKYQFRAIWCGKVTTFMQFTVLLGLTFRVAFPPWIFAIFIVLGLLALIELYTTRGLKVHREAVKN
jgi:CDP-diacylglycerol---glycerol-3-phosphate 3-phosphatidyltransferase